MIAKKSGLTISAALRRVSRVQKRDTNELRVILALERMVARLHSSSRLSDALVYKGGFALFKTVNSSRFTRDLDALALKVPPSLVVSEIQRALRADVDDGFWFGDFKTDILPDHGDYEGIRITAAYHLGGAPASPKISKLSRAHLDIAFGDTLNEGPEDRSLSSVLPEFEPISWKVYPLHYILAEKLQTIVARGSLNSRSKDYYDITVIFERISIDRRLATIVSEVFRHRGTQKPPSFEKYVAQLDHRILRQSWPSVGVESESSFDQCLKRVRQHLNRLDVVISGGP